MAYPLFIVSILINLGLSGSFSLHSPSSGPTPKQTHTKPHAHCVSHSLLSVTFTTLVERYTHVARVMNANVWTSGQRMAFFDRLESHQVP